MVTEPPGLPYTQTVIHFIVDIEHTKILSLKDDYAGTKEISKSTLQEGEKKINDCW